MLTPQATWPEMPGVNSQYGLGWVVTEVDGEVSVGHGGGSPGTAALLQVHPSRQLALAVCLNSTESAAAFFADFIGGWLAATFGTPAWRNPVPPERAPALDLAGYEGAHRRSAMTHRVRFDGGRLWLQSSGPDGQAGPAMELIPHDEQRFLYRRPGQAQYAMLHFLDFDGSRPGTCSTVRSHPELMTEKEVRCLHGQSAHLRL